MTDAPKSAPHPDPEEAADAAAEVVDCMRVLTKSGSNLVLEAIGTQEFVELSHYPPGDVFDPETQSQFYFHAHPPSETRAADFGHFHTFRRTAALPPLSQPTKLVGNPSRWDRTTATTHLVAISMDRFGAPTALFTTNRWVTDEVFYPAAPLIDALPGFLMDVAHPSWALNRWISAMLVLFRPEISRLLHARDSVLDHHAETAAHGGTAPLNDRSIEVPSSMPIDLNAKLAEVRRALGLEAK